MLVVLGFAGICRASVILFLHRPRWRLPLRRCLARIPETETRTEGCWGNQDLWSLWSTLLLAVAPATPLPQQATVFSRVSVTACRLTKSARSSFTAHWQRHIVV